MKLIWINLLLIYRMLFYGRNFNKLMEEGKEITNRRFITSERPEIVPSPQKCRRERKNFRWLYKDL